MVISHFTRTHQQIKLNFILIGGTTISGIHQGEDYNKKWATPFGVRKYNKDAFIVIKNLSRNDDTKSQPMDREHAPHHLKDAKPESTV